MADEHTHEGWFWLCPVLASFDTMGGEQGLVVEARWGWLEPLFSLCEALEAARIHLSSLFIDGYEPSFMFKLRERQ